MNNHEGMCIKLSNSSSYLVSNKEYINFQLFKGVSCDQCVKGNFAGNRYKCLVCYDFDLCHECYTKNVNSLAAANNTTTRTAGNKSKQQPTTTHTTTATATRASNPTSSGGSGNHHSNSHPMQCILTKGDYELHYGPGSVNDYLDQLSFTCPYCGKIGLSEATLSDHLGHAHANNNNNTADNQQQQQQPLLLGEVVCPICAVLSSANGGDPNHLTDDLLHHINMEHLEPFSLEAENNLLRDVGLAASGGAGGAGTASAVAAAAALRFSRRLNNLSGTTSGSGSTRVGGGVNRPTSSRYQAFPGGSLTSFMRSTSNVFDAFGAGGGGGGALGSLGGSSDPIAELLSQLAGVRRATAAAANAHTANLQQLQSQLSRERDSLQQQSAAVALAAAAAAANSTTPSINHLSASGGGGGGGSSIHRHSNSLFYSASNKFINKIGGGASGGGQPGGASLTAQQQANASSMSTNTLITSLLAQALELPANLFGQPVAANVRDSRFLLSK
jgi:hypothetical protein